MCGMRPVLRHSRCQPTPTPRGVANCPTVCGAVVPPLVIGDDGKDWVTDAFSFEVYEDPRASLRHLTRPGSHCQRAETVPLLFVGKHKIFGDLVAPGRTGRSMIAHHAVRSILRRAPRVLPRCATCIGDSNNLLSLLSGFLGKGEERYRGEKKLCSRGKSHIPPTVVTVGMVLDQAK
jgi:hypothetical protein